MRPPIFVLALRLAAENRRLRSDVDRLTATLRLANETGERLLAHGQAWRSRAELLYAAIPPGSVDEFLLDLSDIEDLEETPWTT